MTDADWIEDLERKARAATPGPWVADHSEEDNSAVKQEGRAWWDGLAFCGRPADAKFIAAVDPDTILRLILELQAAERKARRFAYDLRITEAVSDQRAARLAAVEDLVAEWERVQEQNRKALGELARGTSHLLLDTPGPADFRAALAAPTDTTKEN